MNKIGIQFGYWSRDLTFDFPYYIQRVADLGFDIFECPTDSMLEMPKLRLQEIREIAEEKNIELTFSVGLSKEYDISSKDKATRGRGIEYLKRNIEFVHKMNGTVIGGVSTGAWLATMDEGDTDKRPYVERSVKSVKEIAKTAEDYNVIHSVEVVNRFEQFIINTSAEGVEFVNMVGSPNVKILLDTFHMNIEEDNIGEAIITAGDKLGHLHICENNRKLPGQAHIPWEEVASALKKINYKSHVVMEPFVQSGGVVGRALFIWSDRSPKDMDAAAKESLNFIRSKLNT